MAPEKGSLISSKADLPVKQKNKKNSRDEQCLVVSRVQKIEMNQCVNHKLQTKSKQQYQATVFKGRYFQAEKCVHMWSKKPTKDMQLNKPAMLIQHKMLQKQENDKNCQPKECYGSKCVLTRNVKLPSITRKMTKTVKQMLLCGQ